MYTLALRQLVLDWPRTILVAIALGAIFGVILVLKGFEQGQYHQLARTVENRQADLIVAQSGVSNLIAARSSLPQLMRATVESIPGVRVAHPLTTMPVIYEGHGIKTPIYMFVYDSGGGPRHVMQGISRQRGRGIVIDVSLAEKHDIGVGDSMSIADFGFEVTGISERSSALFMPFAFINYDGMIDFMLESEIAPDLSAFPLLSYLLVELEPDAAPAAIADAIESQATEVDVHTTAEMAENDIALARSMLGDVMGLLVLVSYVTGVLVVGLIMFAEVNTRLRGFGVLKAVGFSENRLVLSVVTQAFAYYLLSVPIGLSIALGMAALINSIAPLYYVKVMTAGGLLTTLLAGGVVAIFGGVLPIVRLRRLDPNIAFSRV